MEWSKANMPLMVVEESAYEGVRRIAGKVAEDIGKVLGAAPEVVSERELPARSAACMVLCATLGKSTLLEELEKRGLADFRGLLKEDGSRKREVYQICRIFLKGGDCCLDGREESRLRGDSSEDGREASCPQAEKISGEESLPQEEGMPESILLICGSDKRGTIYGMFSLSEYIGVSPLCYWGDVEPLHQETLRIDKDIETLSREPSVKYRGFFINDEWPCFGSWVTEHFGGFNADAYEHVFELLLRMKGNYLWPAMWTASFPLDGPGSRNEELADIYGVVMGYSHHEPCLRASEEWDKVRGEGSRYGNQWNFYTNEQGLLNYWEDALKRSGKYENIITIGMRGERDSSMLGPDATLRENIDLLKDIITKQKELIRRHVQRENGEIPMLLALYKEVEPYFYGDGNTPGLKDWEGLDGVTCMLCEDNFGYVRTLPGEEIRGHQGGFGMYYHFDYHGAPVSYEWVDCTPYSRIWEQMGQVYEYGIRDVWIVNVGDLKFHEVPLNYFLDIAYDFDRWGLGNPHSYEEYPRLWAERTFPGAASSTREKIGRVLTEYIRINGLRRPESLHAGIYHPCHYEETDRMLARAQELEKLSLQVMEELGDDGQAYYSMIHYPAMASMNVLKMHLYAGKNHHYAAQGRTAANLYGELTRECILLDRKYGEEWGDFRNGKWNGMQLEQHIGFTRWNDDDYRYPVTMRVEPAHRPRLSVSRNDDERTATKAFGAPMTIQVPDFQYAGCERVTLEIANSGCGSLHYRISMEGGTPVKGGIFKEDLSSMEDGRTAEDGKIMEDGNSGKGGAGRLLPQWLEVSPMEGEVETLEEVVLLCHRDKLPMEPQKVRLLIEDGDARVAVEILGRAVPAADSRQAQAQEAQLPELTFLERNGVIAIGAEHFYRKTDTAKGSFQVMEGYGKFGSGVKVFPGTAAFGEEEEKPWIHYRFVISEAGEYQVELLTAPSNPVKSGQSVNLMVKSKEGRALKAEVIPVDYRGGDFWDGRWCAAALDQEHRASVTVELGEGVQELAVGGMEAGTVVEKLLIYKKGTKLPASYLGPQESYYIQKG